MEHMVKEILQRVRSHDEKFASINNRLDISDSKMDEQSKMLRALLDVNETRKANMDAHEVRIAKIEGTVKGQAKLAIEELGR